MGLLYYKLSHLGIPDPRLKNPIQLTFALQKVIAFLKSEHESYVNKNFTDTHLIERLFNQKTFFTEKEYHQHMKAQFHLAVKSFNELVKKMQGENTSIEYSTIILYKKHLINYLYDLKEIIEYFRRPKDKEFILFDAYRSQDIHSFEIMKAANNSFWDPIPETYPSGRTFIMNSNNSIFLLRQAIEIKFKSIFGIKNIKLQNGIRLKNDYLANFISENMEAFELNNVELRSLLKIYNWTNSGIHLAIKPRIWELQFALKICSAFFEFETSFDEKGNPTTMRLFGNVKINDFSKTCTLLEEKLKSEYGSEILIDWSRLRESLDK